MCHGFVFCLTNLKTKKPTKQIFVKNFFSFLFLWDNIKTRNPDVSGSLCNLTVIKNLNHHELTFFSMIAKSICDAGKIPIKYQKLNSCHDLAAKKTAKVDQTFMQYKHPPIGL